MDLKNSLAARITVYLELILIIPLLLVVVFFMLRSAFTAQSSRQNAMQDRAALVSSYLENYFNVIDSEILEFSSEPYIIRISNQNYTHRGDVRNMKSALPEICIRSGAVNAYLYLYSTNLIYSAFGLSSEEEIKCIVDDIRLHAEKYVDGLNVKEISRSEINYLLCSRPLHDGLSNVTRGAVIVRVPTGSLYQYFKGMNSDDTGIFLITDGGETVYGQSGFAADIEFDRLDMESLDHQYINGLEICIHAVEGTNLKVAVVNAAQSSFIVRNHQFPETGLLITILFVYLISILAAALVLRKLLKPFSMLANAIAGADPDNLKEIKIARNNNEVLLIQESYNSAVQRINEMINTKYRTELALRQAQINTLQYQINPHFVNNSLQMIGSLALQHEMDDVYDLITAFSGIFFYNLKFKGGNFVVFQDEIDFFDNYIRLQKARFKDVLTVYTDIASDTANIQVPKMIIQPIVENCFSHAFFEKTSDWKIWIKGYVQDTVLVISIKDNGSGMSPEMQDILNRELSNPDASMKDGTSHIGIRNVNARLCMLYGSEFRLRFISSKDGGTEFIIQIPIVM